MIRIWPLHGHVLAVVAAHVPFMLAAAAQAQPRGDTFEVGIAVSLQRMHDLHPYQEALRQQGLWRAPPREWGEPGIGVRLTYRADKGLGYEVEVSLFPRYSESGPSVELHGGDKEQLVGGVRIGRHFSGIGLFLKVRPGLTRYGRPPAVVGVAAEPGRTLVATAEVEPALCPTLDLGAIATVDLGRRLLIRIDLGNTRIWYRPKPHDLNPEFARNNLQTSVGVGLRF